MGIHGLFKEIGPGQRISFAKLSSDHYIAHNRPLKLAIDISIWLFQIQSGKGGSNPALRTFYYRLLRLLSLNIHPLFVFDGPNKPLFKRNKKVGGPGVRVASVPEFLAKQLLKQFGFPWHVAPGEAEAECALLQREGIVDAVLSEDVDTLMFGSGMTLRNWTSENSTKSPTHVNVYRAVETKEKSGMDREGMILVALMSGGDYLPEGIPRCGPKVACDAARAGFGRDLCKLGKKDTAGLRLWKDRLQHQIRTNEAKFFSRKNTGFTIPDDFPNLDVLGYYTHPCVSSPEKLARLRQELRWDQDIDYAALRTFTADAFDWRCVGGAKKFIKNLAPAILIRELRLCTNSEEHRDQDAQEEHEKRFARAIHGKRNHSTTDGELEYRITFLPAGLVPIDLSLEDEDDEFIPAGGVAEDSDAESEFMTLPSSTAADNDSEAPTSPTKKRNFRPYDPSQPEKLWVLRTFLQIGCPLLIEDYEASTTDPREFLKARRKARAAAKGDGNIHSKTKKGGKAKNDMPENALMSYAKVTKPASGAATRALKELSPQANTRSNAGLKGDGGQHNRELEVAAGFKLPSTQVPAHLLQDQRPRTYSQTVEVLDMAAATGSSSQRQIARSVSVSAERPFAAFAAPKKLRTNQTSNSGKQEVQRAPRRTKKRPSPDMSSPAASQRTITSYYSPSPRNSMASAADIVNLISSSPVHVLQDDPLSRPLTPTPPNRRCDFTRSTTSPPSRPDFSPGKLPDTVTKRRKKTPLKRWQTEPTFGFDEYDDVPLPTPTFEEATPTVAGVPRLSDMRQSDVVEALDLITSSPAREQEDLPSPSTFIELRPSQPVLPEEHVDEPRAYTSMPLRPSPHKPALRKPSLVSQPIRRSPRQQAKKKRIQLRESLEGAWKEVEAETIDMSGDGSGWKKSGGRAKIVGDGGWRKSGVEVLDLTGA